MANSNIPITEPNEFYLSDRIEWDVETFQNGFDISDFPNTSYTLKYYFWGSASASVSVTATAQGAYYRITILPATSATYTVGNYKYVAQIENTVGTVVERNVVREGTFEIKLRPSTATATDSRTHIKKVHETIKTLLEGRAAKEADTISIGGRSLSRIPIAELVKLERHYSYLIRQEEQSEKIKKGIDSANRILVRF